MGEIRVDVSDMHNVITTVALTAEGAAELARRGHYIEIPSRDIEDKSKANLLAKGLVVLQVSWLWFR